MQIDVYFTLLNFTFSVSVCSSR